MTSEQISEARRLISSGDYWRCQQSAADALTRALDALESTREELEKLQYAKHDRALDETLTQLDEARAQVANWERKEVERGSCCSDMEAERDSWKCRAEEAERGFKYEGDVAAQAIEDVKALRGQVETAKEIMSGLLDAMRRWANEGDGLPDFAASHFNRAWHLLNWASGNAGNPAACFQPRAAPKDTEPKGCGNYDQGCHCTACMDAEPKESEQARAALAESQLPKPVEASSKLVDERSHNK